MRSRSWTLPTRWKRCRTAHMRVEPAHKSCSVYINNNSNLGAAPAVPVDIGRTLMSDDDLRPSCSHGETTHDPALSRAHMRASRREFIKGVIASGVAVSSAGYVVLGRGTAHAQAAGAVGRLVTLNVNGRARPGDVLP